MGRPRGPIRNVAEATGLDQATVRRALEVANIAESEIAARFDDVCVSVRAIADDAKAAGHASLGRGETGGGNISELAQVRTEHARAQIEKIRIQNQREMGKLVDRADATETITHILGDLRTTLLAMGGKLAPTLAGQTDVRSIANLIDAEVRDTLAAFTDESKFFAALENEALS